MSTLNSSSEIRTSHILVFPFPAQGHILPLLDLTHQLAIRGLTITVLITPKNLPILHHLLSLHPSIQTLILPFPTNTSSLIPTGIENMKDLPPTYFKAMMRALSELYYPILNWFKSNPSPPMAIISDFLLGWTQKLSCQLGIKRIVFSPDGALTLSILSSLWQNLSNNSDAVDLYIDNPHKLISFPRVPNCPICPWWHLPAAYRLYRKGDPISEFVKDDMLANLASWGMVFNSFNNLERVYLEHMKNVMGHKRVWGVGPLLPPPRSFGPIENGGSNSSESRDTLSWLDTCEDHSVVYVCFGSQAVLNNKQMEELASGLELSRARFIWVVKEAPIGQVSEDYGVVPPGFEDRVKGKGLIIRGWAPQKEILKHRSIGLFLTHCGWNSVMESLVAGVPMLTWPMGSDQFFNATLLVDYMGVAIRACEGENSVPNPAELARVVTNSLSESNSERVRAIQLSKAALVAVQEGGSSFEDLDGLADSLFGLTI